MQSATFSSVVSNDSSLHVASDVSNCMQGIEPERNETNNYQICELGGFTLSLADKSYECRIKQIRANFKVRDRIVDLGHAIEVEGIRL